MGFACPASRLTYRTMTTLAYILDRVEGQARQSNFDDSFPHRKRPEYDGIRPVEPYFSRALAAVLVLQARELAGNATEEHEAIVRDAYELWDGAEEGRRLGSIFGERLAYVPGPCRCEQCVREMIDLGYLPKNHPPGTGPRI